MLDTLKRQRYIGRRVVNVEGMGMLTTEKDLESAAVI